MLRKLLVLALTFTLVGCSGAVYVRTPIAYEKPDKTVVFSDQLATCWFPIDFGQSSGPCNGKGGALSHEAVDLVGGIIDAVASLYRGPSPAPTIVQFQDKTPVVPTPAQEEPAK